ncbi:hypothetical protein CYLTODRAFT_316136, partial [Cylindrobasidium torrendii FP15055 ss-10]
AGHMRSVKNNNVGLETDVNSALQVHDLRGPMLRAKDMVKFAAGLNEKLSASTSIYTAKLEETTS